MRINTQLRKLLSKKNVKKIINVFGEKSLMYLSPIKRLCDGFSFLVKVGVKAMQQKKNIYTLKIIIMKLKISFYLINK